jgi:hypothetical protein
MPDKNAPDEKKSPFLFNFPKHKEVDKGQEARAKAQHLANTLPGLYDTNKRIVTTTGETGTPPTGVSGALRKDHPVPQDEMTKFRVAPIKIVKPEIPLVITAATKASEEPVTTITTSSFNVAQMKIAAALKEKGILVASLIPKIGRDKVLEYFDLAYKSVLAAMDTTANIYFQYLGQLNRQLQSLIERVPYSPEAHQLANGLEGLDIYTYFHSAPENIQRFSEAVCLLYCMTRDNTTLSEKINRNNLQNTQVGILPQHVTRLFRRISDLFVHASEQDLTIMSLRDRGIILASLLPRLGAEKMDACWHTLVKPFLSMPVSAQDTFSGRIRFLHILMQKLLVLAPYSDEAQRLASQMFGYEAYLYFYYASQDQQRFSDACYLLSKMHLNNMPFFKFVNIQRFLYPQQPLFTEDYHRHFRRESDLWDNMPRNYCEFIKTV